MGWLTSELERSDVDLGKVSSKLYAELLEVAPTKPKKVTKRMDELRRAMTTTSAATSAAAQGELAAAVPRGGEAWGLLLLQQVVAPMEASCQRDLRTGAAGAFDAQLVLDGVTSLVTSLVCGDGAAKRPQLQRAALELTYRCMLRESGRSVHSSPWGTLPQAAQTARTAGGAAPFPPLPWGHAFVAAVGGLSAKGFAALLAHLSPPSGSSGGSGAATAASAGDSRGGEPEQPETPASAMRPPALIVDSSSEGGSSAGSSPAALASAPNSSSSGAALLADPWAAATSTATPAPAPAAVAEFSPLGAGAAAVAAAGAAGPSPSPASVPTTAVAAAGNPPASAQQQQQQQQQQGHHGGPLAMGAAGAAFAPEFGSSGSLGSGSQDFGAGAEDTRPSVPLSARVAGWGRGVRSVLRRKGSAGSGAAYDDYDDVEGQHDSPAHDLTYGGGGAADGALPDLTAMSLGADVAAASAGTNPRDAAPPSSLPPRPRVTAGRIEGFGSSGASSGKKAAKGGSGKLMGMLRRPHSTPDMASASQQQQQQQQLQPPVTAAATPGLSSQVASSAWDASEDPLAAAVLRAQQQQQQQGDGGAGDEPHLDGNNAWRRGGLGARVASSLPDLRRFARSASSRASSRASTAGGDDDDDAPAAAAAATGAGVAPTAAAAAADEWWAGPPAPGQGRLSGYCVSLSHDSGRKAGARGVLGSFRRGGGASASSFRRVRELDDM